MYTFWKLISKILIYPWLQWQLNRIYRKAAVRDVKLDTIMKLAKDLDPDFLPQLIEYFEAIEARNSTKACQKEFNRIDKMATVISKPGKERPYESI